MPRIPLLKKALVLLTLVVVTVLLVVLRPDRPQAVSEPALPRVVVTEVARQDVHPTEVVTGRLQPARRSELRFEVAGRVVARRVEPGDRVEAGDVLLEIEAGDYRDTLAEAEAQLELEQSQVERDRRLLELARRNAQLQRGEVQRLASLNDRSMISASQLDEARIRLAQLESELAGLETSVNGAEARMALRRAAVQRAQRNLARTRLAAPFTGTVNDVRLDVGDFAAAGQIAAVLIDTTRLDFTADLRGEVARELALGDTVRVEVGDRTVTGRIQALQEEPSETTYTHRVRVRLPGEGLRPGRVARAAFPLPVRRDARLVPVTAVLRDGGRSYVFRVTADNRLERAAVRLGLREADRYVVLEGIDAGERIVARDVAALSDGQSVETADG